MDELLELLQVEPTIKKHHDIVKYIPPKIVTEKAPPLEGNMNQQKLQALLSDKPKVKKDGNSQPTKIELKPQPKQIIIEKKSQITQPNGIKNVTHQKPSLHKHDTVQKHAKTHSNSKPSDPNRQQYQPLKVEKQIIKSDKSEQIQLHIEKQNQQSSSQQTQQTEIIIQKKNQVPQQKSEQEPQKDKERMKEKDNQKDTLKEREKEKEKDKEKEREKQKEKEKEKEKEKKEHPKSSLLQPINSNSKNNQKHQLSQQELEKLKLQQLLQSEAPKKDKKSSKKKESKIEQTANKAKVAGKSKEDERRDKIKSLTQNKPKSFPIKPKIQDLSSKINKQKQNNVNDDYDLEDSFINDSEDVNMDDCDPNEIKNTFKLLQKKKKVGMIENDDDDIEEDGYEQLRLQEKKSRMIGIIEDYREEKYIIKEKKEEKLRRKMLEQQRKQTNPD